MFHTQERSDRVPNDHVENADAIRSAKSVLHLVIEPVLISQLLEQVEDLPESAASYQLRRETWLRGIDLIGRAPYDSAAHYALCAALCAIDHLVVPVTRAMGAARCAAKALKAQ